jgi:hypothetical protein
MKRFFMQIIFAVMVLTVSHNVYAQHEVTERERTREQLRQLLERVGATSEVKVTFRQSEKQPYNFVGVMKEGLVSCDSLEIVIGVTQQETIGFRIYPHYKGEYVNVDKAKNGAGLMRKLLQLNDENFLFWGMDSSSDIFAGYTFTLESGFPEEALTIVVRSIRNTDKFVGAMRPLIDGTPTP